MRELFAALIEEGAGQPEYAHIKHSDQVSFVPVWTSAKGASEYLAREGIKGSAVVFSPEAYKRALKWHQDLGLALFLQLQFGERDA